VSVRLSSRLPADDRDGLAPEEARLRDEASAAGSAELIAVVVLRVVELRDRLADGNDPHAVYVVADQLEPLTGKAAATARGLLGKAYEQRTGKVALPGIRLG
jgi:hypothetical protein